MLDILDENRFQQKTPRHLGCESLSQDRLADGTMSDIGGHSRHFGCKQALPSYPADANAKGPAFAGPFLLLRGERLALEIHPAHTAHSAASRRHAAGASVLLRQFGHHGFGGD
jgi:hypothetical protein